MTRQPTDSSTPQSSAIIAAIQTLLSDARYVAAAAVHTHPDFSSFEMEIIADTVGAAIGLGETFRRKEPADDTPLETRIRSFETASRYLASATARLVGLREDTQLHDHFTQTIVEVALATAIAKGRFRAPRFNLSDPDDAARALGLSGPQRGPQEVK